MAVLDNLQDDLAFLTPKITKETAHKLVSQIVWMLFDEVKEQSFSLKVKLGFISIPISFKIEKLSPLIEQLVGPRPFPN